MTRIFPTIENLILLITHIGISVVKLPPIPFPRNLRHYIAWDVLSSLPSCFHTKMNRMREKCSNIHWHYDDIIMDMIASQTTSLVVVYSIVYSGVDQSKHQSSASLAFVWGIHRGPVNSPHKWPVTRKIFPFDDVIMILQPDLHRSFNGLAGTFTYTSLMTHSVYWPHHNSLQPIWFHRF